MLYLDALDIVLSVVTRLEYDDITMGMEVEVARLEEAIDTLERLKLELQVAGR